MTIATTMMSTIVTATPPITAAVLSLPAVILGGRVRAREGLGSLDGGEGLEHSGSLGEEMATEQLASIVISTPATMTLAPPPLTQASIKGMSVPLSVSEVPSSLARYVRNDGDSSKQENDCSSNVHSAHPAFNICSILVSMSFSFCSVSVAYSDSVHRIQSSQEISMILTITFGQGNTPLSRT